MNKHDQRRSSDLEKVLAGEPHHEADRLRDVWELAGSNESIDFPNPATIERVWQSIDAFAASHEGSHPQPRVDRVGSSKLRLVTLRPWMAVAATLLIGATVGVLALWMSPVVKTAVPGQRLAVTLPDGSQIELNSGTTVRYARRFGQERVVHLEGEAYFDVVEEERPFIVHTFNARVAVLGTQFNVRAWSQSMDPGTTVTLESGRVALAPAGRPDQAVELEPGQTRRIAEEADEPSPPDTVSVQWVTAWRTGDLVFKDQWLGVILEDVERRFGIDLALEPVTLRQKRLTVVQRNPVSAEAVIRDACTALGLNYRETSVGYELYASAPQ